MQHLQKSLALITPILQVNDSRFYDSIKNSYLGNIEYEGEINWGDYLYLELKENVEVDLLATLRKHRWYEDELHQHEAIIFVFKIPKKEKTKIVDPFLKGKYSEIDKDYVDKNFNFKINGRLSINYRICNKDEAIRAYWENKIGLPLPENAEVWSKPEERDEIYGYAELLRERELEVID